MGWFKAEVRNRGITQSFHDSRDLHTFPSGDSVEIGLGLRGEIHKTLQLMHGLFLRIVRQPKSPKVDPNTFFRP
jgi:hypothetical protein